MREERPNPPPRRTGEALRFSVFGLFAGLLSCTIGAAAAGDSASFKTLRLEGNGVRWQVAAKGQQRVLSYAIVAQDVEFAGARNCRKMTKLDTLLSTSPLAPAGRSWAIATRRRSAHSNQATSLVSSCSTASASRTASLWPPSRLTRRGTLPRSGSTPSAGEPGPSPHALSELPVSESSVSR